MIPQASITAWSLIVPWANRDQVEQDLALSRLICEIANHPLLGKELVFRGGTCLHKLHLSRPLRYSEDLDYVRVTRGPIGAVLDAARDIAQNLGMECSTDVGQYPKVMFRSEYESGSGRLRVKLEINTYDIPSHLPHVTLPFQIDSAWWTGSAEILTFQTPELISTKLRALYQRRKGRDLFDLWLALTVMEVDPAAVISCFERYRPDGYTAALAMANLDGHLADRGFRHDLDALVVDDLGFDVDVAGELVKNELLSQIAG